MVIPRRGTLFQLTIFRPGSTAASLHHGEPSIVCSLTARASLPHHATSQRASQTWRWSLRGAVSIQVYKRCRRGISRWETFSRDHLSNRNTAEPPAVVIRSTVQSLIWRKGRRKKGPFITTWQNREQTTPSNHHRPSVIFWNSFDHEDRRGHSVGHLGTTAVCSGYSIPSSESRPPDNILGEEYVLTRNDDIGLGKARPHPRAATSSGATQLVVVVRFRRC